MIGAVCCLLTARQLVACGGRQQRQPRSARELSTLLWTFNPLRPPLLRGVFGSDCTAVIRLVLTTNLRPPALCFARLQTTTCTAGC